VKKTTTKKSESTKEPKPVKGISTKDMKAKKAEDEEKDPPAEKGKYERRDLRAKD
jgi:hypothetical protein